MAAQLAVHGHTDYPVRMITVVIPTLNAAADLGPTLAALVPAVIDGVVADVVIADGGSDDETVKVAELSGAKLVTAQAGRGAQLAAGASAGRGDWLLFLHADTVLSKGWHEEVARHIARIGAGRVDDQAAAFRFALDDAGLQPRMLEAMVRLRCQLFKLPYGDQGLLISRALYDDVGGFKEIPLMEDVDLVWRLGRRRIGLLETKAVTSSIRFRRDGYFMRSTRNLALLMLFVLRVPPTTLARYY